MKKSSTLLPADDDGAKKGENTQQNQVVLEQRFDSSGAIHQNLRIYREKMKLQKKEMATLMEVTSRTYYAYEEGVRAIPAPCLVRLAILTGGDLNEILMGRPVAPKPQVIESAIADFVIVMRFLDTEYEDMDLKTATDIARMVVSTDWNGLPRIHPEMIRDAVRLVTRYRFHPEDLPAPPMYNDYGGDDERFEEDAASWQRIVDEDFAPDKTDVDLAPGSTGS